MIRRRHRRVRETPFGFDSFLDVVANVVGIIIRMILVVWVGARSYSALKQIPPKADPVAEAAVARREVEDPFQKELAEHRQELTRARQRLLEQLRQLQQVEGERSQLEGRLAALSSRRQQLERERLEANRSLAEQHGATKAVSLSVAEIRERRQRLGEEIRALEKLPPARQMLRYRTPVSKPVDSEEVLFECRHGRVAFIDIAGLLAEIRRDLRDQGQLLRDRWEVSATAGPVGPFRLRYVLERERGAFEAVAGAGPPDPDSNFRYGLSGWEIEPVVLDRGETLAAALAPGSEFRNVVDTLDPQQTVVTFWVYEDSFALYRQLRDYLYERDLVVAGRPLPDGAPIASSRHGTLSRGQ